MRNVKKLTLKKLLIVNIRGEGFLNHYFTNSQKSAEDYFAFTDTFNNVKYSFNSSKGVFSNTKIDDGTNVLLTTVIKEYPNMQGKVLDIGCGIGVIGIILQDNYKNLQLTMVDVNSTAVELAKENLKNHKLNAAVLESDIYQNVTEKEFDFIITNPPIKAGKKVLWQFVSEGCNHLKGNGSIILVIRKKHGQESLFKLMKQIYGNCKVLKRDAGYYIMQSTKNY